MSYDIENYLFSDGDLSLVLKQQIDSIKNKVNSISKDQFLTTTEKDIIENIYLSTSIEPIELHEDSKEREQEEVSLVINDYGRTVTIPGVRVIISIPYSGTSILWKLKPSHRQGVFPKAVAHHSSNGKGGHIDIIIEQASSDDPKKIKQSLEETLDTIKSYLDSQKTQIEQFNSQVPGDIKKHVTARYEQLKIHNGIAEILDIPLKSKDSVPDIKSAKIKRKLVEPLSTVPVKKHKTELGISEEENREETASEIDPLLDSIDTSLKKKRIGAWITFKSTNPDRLSQAANSMVELLDKVIGSVCQEKTFENFLEEKYGKEEIKWIKSKRRYISQTKEKLNRVKHHINYNDESLTKNLLLSAEQIIEMILN